jgi:MFS family permease
MIVGVIGPPVGGWLATRIGFRGLMLVGAIPYFLSFILRLVLARWERVQREGSTWRLDTSSLVQDLRETRNFLVNNAMLIWFLVIAGIAEMLIKLSRELLPVYVEQISHLSIEQIGILGSVYGIAFMLVAIPAGRLADKTEPRFSITLGFILSAFGLLGIVLTRSFLSIAGFWFLFGAGNGFLVPILSTLLSHIIPKSLLGRMFGLFWTVRTAISMPVSWVGSQLWAAFTPVVPFALTAIIAVVFAVICLQRLKIGVKAL